MRKKGTAKLYMGRSVGVLGKGAFVQHLLYIITERHIYAIQCSLFSSFDYVNMVVRKCLSVSYFINRQLPAADLRPS
jgi:hypothetical protein